MEKFPLDVATAETLTDGDPNIITREDFMPQFKKGNQSCWAEIFKTDRKTVTSPNKSSLKMNKSKFSFLSNFIFFEFFRFLLRMLLINIHVYLNFKVHLHQKVVQQQKIIHLYKNEQEY